MIPALINSGSNIFKGIALKFQENTFTLNQLRMLENIVKEHGTISSVQRFRVIFAGGKLSNSRAAILIANEDTTQASEIDFASDKWISSSIEAGKLLDQARFAKIQANSGKLQSSNCAKKQRRAGNSLFKFPPGFVNYAYECQRRTPLECPNDDLVKLLEVVENHRYLIGDDHGSYSYRRAIATIKAYPKKLDCVEEAAALSGIGRKIASMVDEWLSDGSIKIAIEAQNNAELKILSQLTRVHGIGPKTALDLKNKGVETIDELSKAVLEGKARLKYDQSIGLKYVEDFDKKISRKTLESIAESIRDAIATLRLPECLVVIVGGYRRGKEENGDADILISPTNQDNMHGTLQTIIEYLCKEGFVTDILQLVERHVSKGGSSLRSKLTRKTTFDPLDKCLCVYKTPDGVHRRLDVLVAPRSQFPFALLGWTGSRQFERSIRLYADKERGISLSSHAIVDKNTGEKYTVENEKEIFTLLGLEYIEPEFRNC